MRLVVLSVFLLSPALRLLGSHREQGEVSQRRLLGESLTLQWSEVFGGDIALPDLPQCVSQCVYFLVCVCACVQPSRCLFLMAVLVLCFLPTTQKELCRHTHTGLKQTSHLKFSISAVSCRSVSLQVLPCASDSGAAGADVSSQGGSVPLLLHHGREHPQTEDADPGHSHDAAQRLPGEHPEALGQDRRDRHETGDA